jgi:hypothetical protein
MKLKLIAAIAAVLFVGAAQAQTVTSTSVATTGSISVTGVVNNGFGMSVQQSGATAWNASAAAAGLSPYAGSATLVGADGTASTAASSAGATTSYAKGINLGSAFGASGAVAAQSGSADAQAVGGYLSFTGLHAFGATSSAGVGSGSVAANVNNGIAANGTQVGAENQSQGTSRQTSLFGNYTDAASVGATSNVSGGVSFGAFGATGGYATQNGAGVGF